MKHYFLLLLLVGTASFAQNKPIFGINLGGTYANIRGNEVANRNNYDLNFLVGGSIEIALNEKFSFLGNINYERKTYEQKFILILWRQLYHSLMNLCSQMSVILKIRNA
jgi:hypothetical protein